MSKLKSFALSAGIVIFGLAFVGNTVSFLIHLASEPMVAIGSLLGAIVAGATCYFLDSKRKNLQKA